MEAIFCKSVRIDTFPGKYRKCLLINYLSCVLAKHTLFVYNSVIGVQNPESERNSIPRTELRGDNYHGFR